MPAARLLAMPKQTFRNLPEEKREAFVGIALEEFARNDYASASVSRIVARAGIAKGSVYQYFEDKRDLFLYLLERAQQTLLEALGGDVPPDPEHGFFAALRWQMGATVRAALAHPLEARLVRRAYASPLPFHDEVLGRGRALRREYLRRMVERAVSRGEFAATVDPDVATMVIESVVAELGPFLLEVLGLDAARAAEADTALFDGPKVQRVFDDVTAILECGMGSRGAPPEG